MTTVRARSTASARGVPALGGARPRARRYDGRDRSAQPRRFDCIVVGVGGMGSAACYHLARRHQRVLGLEQYDIPHTYGSSHGQTRIIRLAYYEDPSYVLLLRRAYELWRDIEQTAGERLLHVTGSIDAGPPDSWVFKGSVRSCIEHGLDHTVLTSAELTERFPAYRLPPETLACYQPDGGFLVPERAVVAYVQAAQAHGAEIHGREQLLEWEPIGDDGVRVVTDRDVYEADRLVVTAGAWNRQVLPFLADLAVPERQVLAWFAPSERAPFHPSAFPVFNVLVDEGRFYGLPEFGVPGFKVGRYHHFEEQGDPDELDFTAHREDEELLRDFTRRHFPGADGPTMALQACMFTNAPDRHFIIDLHPEHPQVAFASACSGHGFKFASVVGEVLADLAERGDTRHNIDLFRLERLLGAPTRTQRTRERHVRERRRLAVAEARQPVAAGAALTAGAALAASARPAGPSGAGRLPPVGARPGTNGVGGAGRLGGNGTAAPRTGRNGAGPAPANGTGPLDPRGRGWHEDTTLPDAGRGARRSPW